MKATNKKTPKYVSTRDLQVGDVFKNGPCINLVIEKSDCQLKVFNLASNTEWVFSLNETPQFLLLDTELLIKE